MMLRNVFGAVASVVLVGGVAPAALAGDRCYDGYYGGGYYAPAYYGAPVVTYAAAPVYVAPAPVYCAPAPIYYDCGPRVYSRTYVARSHYPAYRSHRVYRSYDRGVSVHAGYRGGNYGRGFSAGFSYRD